MLAFSTTSDSIAISLAAIKALLCQSRRLRVSALFLNERASVPITFETETSHPKQALMDDGLEGRNHID